MKVLLAEYTKFHDPVLAPEGEAMLTTLRRSFEALGYDVLSPTTGDFAEEIARLAPDCRYGLIIAPDHLLAGFTSVMEGVTHNVGTDSTNAAVCANKRLSARLLAEHGIDVPREVTSGRRVIKPIRGSGSMKIRIRDEEPGEAEFGQEILTGDHISVSVIASRVVGDACSFYTGAPPLVLAINRQRIDTDDDGIITYLGGETPIEHPRAEEIRETAEKVVTTLGCQGYIGIDMIVGERITVVDVNPRITTSLIGIAGVMEEEIADLLIKASEGVRLPPVHLNGSVAFDTRGGMTRQ
ncbi:MAG: ATP-grasp domain-containing protein [Methanocalculus sp. MSAO_Arc1]|uniref:ATP-grasp domain-containing protein n=1 Tax=Methanocalculus TaxID=71151 RepID=UPI000FEFC458|nr:MULTISPECIES: ATP-grasp domain-containing protein [unclassified Methanocalculus]MCP1662537.1 putative ATP-grasp superfamily ATP-dependent carboligase [Methanocalculus sp. AMF5]RQD80092.1 MAG: ATP-grasp domain-containing protein [Methanocalculus sp. MSAO_Arc1]